MGNGADSVACGRSYRPTAVCNQATSVPAHPIECHRARRERCSYGIAKPLRIEQPSLDSLENTIGTSETTHHARSMSETDGNGHVSRGLASRGLSNPLSSQPASRKLAPSYWPVLYPKREPTCRQARQRIRFAGWIGGPTYSSGKSALSTAAQK